VFERFMVAKNDVAFRSTLHKHKLNFMRRTKVFRISGTEIPQNHFDFMPFDEILSKTNEDQLLGNISISLIRIHYLSPSFCLFFESL
jgi:hypothetical protein